MNKLLPIKLGLLSFSLRFLSIFILLFISSLNLIPCFDCSTHFSFDAFQSLIRWDTVHFFSIDSIYRREQHFAFAPGLFEIINHFRSFLSYSFPSFFQHHHHLLVTISLLASFFSTASAVLLFFLTLEIFHSIEFARLTTILHILSPSPPTQVVPYTEPFFAFFSFSTIYGYVLMKKCSQPPSNTQHLLKKILLKCFVASLGGLATSFRSLGILHSAFWCFDYLHFLVILFFQTPPYRSSRKKSCSKKLLLVIVEGLETSIMTLITCSPFIYDQWVGYQQFCQFTPDQDYNGVEIRNISSNNPRRPWCSNFIPSIYNFVQAHYWGNGFLNYWTFNQFPLFVLSFPIYWITIKSLFEYYRYYHQYIQQKIRFNSVKAKSIGQTSKGKIRTNQNEAKEQGHEAKQKYRAFFTPNIATYAHIQLILTIILLFNSHVQIILRQASTMPFIWWGLAHQISSSWDRSSCLKLDLDNDLQRPKLNLKKNSKKKFLFSHVHSFLCNLNLISLYFYWLVNWWPISLLLWAGFYPPA